MVVLSMTNHFFLYRQLLKKKMMLSCRMSHMWMGRSTLIMVPTLGWSLLHFQSHPISTYLLTRHRLGKGVQVNSSSTFIDTVPITIGARTLIGPNCSFF